jgi:hypothetical protein
MENRKEVNITSIKRIKILLALYSENLKKTYQLEDTSIGCNRPAKKCLLEQTQ